MVTTTLREFWHAQPFIPFSIHLADGRSLPVPHPDFFSMSRKGGQIFVFDADDGVNVLHPLLIVSISRAEAPSLEQGNGASH